MALEYRRAEAETEYLEALYQLVQRTIRQAYPRYYPRGIVEFFGALHTKERIMADVDSGLVRSLFVDGRLIGTGSCMGNHITRLFIEPELQGRGYGSFMMERLEKKLLRSMTAAFWMRRLQPVAFMSVEVIKPSGMKRCRRAAEPFWCMKLWKNRFESKPKAFKSV